MVVRQPLAQFYRPMSHCLRDGRALARPEVRPVIHASNFDNGAAGEWTELASWVADRHHCEGLNILRYPEHRLYLVLAPNMVRSDGGAEAERPAGEYNVLYCWIDACTSNTLDVGLLESKVRTNVWRQRFGRRQLRPRLARDQNYGRIAHMVPQVGARSHKALELLFGHVYRAAPCRVHCAGNVGGFSVDRPELVALLWVANDDESPVLCVTGRRCADCRVEDLRDYPIRHRVLLELAQRTSCMD